MECDGLVPILLRLELRLLRIQWRLLPHLRLLPAWIQQRLLNRIQLRLFYWELRLLLTKELLLINWINLWLLLRIHLLLVYWIHLRLLLKIELLLINWIHLRLLLRIHLLLFYRVELRLPGLQSRHLNTLYSLHVDVREADLRDEVILGIGWVLERLPRIEAGWRLGVTGELVVSIQVCIKLIVKLRFHLR